MPIISKVKSVFSISLIFFALNSLHAISFVWQPRSAESGFQLDIPADWDQSYLVKKNGVIVEFRNKDALVEVRSFGLTRDVKLQSLVNQKAARLSAIYSSIRQLYERPSKYRPAIYLAAWKMTKNSKTTVEQSAFLINANKVLVLSCSVPFEDLRKHQTVFENAVFSINFIGDYKLDEQTPLFDNPTNIVQYNQSENVINQPDPSLKRLDLYNRPNLNSPIFAEELKELMP